MAGYKVEWTANSEVSLGSIPSNANFLGQQRIDGTRSLLYGWDTTTNEAVLVVVDYVNKTIGSWVTTSGVGNSETYVVRHLGGSDWIILGSNAIVGLYQRFTISGTAISLTSQGTLFTYVSGDSQAWGDAIPIDFNHFAVVANNPSLYPDVYTDPTYGWTTPWWTWNIYNVPSGGDATLVSRGSHRFLPANTGAGNTTDGSIYEDYSGVYFGVGFGVYRRGLGPSGSVAGFPDENYDLVHISATTSGVSIGSSLGPVPLSGTWPTAFDVPSGHIWAIVPTALGSNLRTPGRTPGQATRYEITTGGSLVSTDTLTWEGSSTPHWYDFQGPQGTGAGVTAWGSNLMGSLTNHPANSFTLHLDNSHVRAEGTNDIAYSYATPFTNMPANDGLLGSEIQYAWGLGDNTAAMIFSHSGTLYIGHVYEVEEGPFPGIPTFSPGQDRDHLATTGQPMIVDGSDALVQTYDTYWHPIASYEFDMGDHSGIRPTSSTPTVNYTFTTAPNGADATFGDVWLADMRVTDTLGRVSRWSHEWTSYGDCWVKWGEVATSPPTYYTEFQDWMPDAPLPAPLIAAGGSVFQMNPTERMMMCVKQPASDRPGIAYVPGTSPDGVVFGVFTEWDSNPARIGLVLRFDPVTWSGFLFDPVTVSSGVISHPQRLYYFHGSTLTELTPTATHSNSTSPFTFNAVSVKGNDFIISSNGSWTAKYTDSRNSSFTNYGFWLASDNENNQFSLWSFGFVDGARNKPVIGTRSTNVARSMYHEFWASPPADYNEPVDVKWQLEDDPNNNFDSFADTSNADLGDVTYLHINEASQSGVGSIKKLTAFISERNGSEGYPVGRACAVSVALQVTDGEPATALADTLSLPEIVSTTVFPAYVGDATQASDIPGFSNLFQLISSTDPVEYLSGSTNSCLVLRENGSQWEYDIRTTGTATHVKYTFVPSFQFLLIETVTIPQQVSAPHQFGSTATYTDISAVTTGGQILVLRMPRNSSVVTVDRWTQSGTSPATYVESRNISLPAGCVVNWSHPIANNGADWGSNGAAAWIIPVSNNGRPDFCAVLASYNTNTNTWAPNIVDAVSGNVTSQWNRLGQIYQEVPLIEGSLLGFGVGYTNSNTIQLSFTDTSSRAYKWINLGVYSNSFYPNNWSTISFGVGPSGVSNKAGLGFSGRSGTTGYCLTATDGVWHSRLHTPQWDYTQTPDIKLSSSGGGCHIQAAPFATFDEFDTSDGGDSFYKTVMGFTSWFVGYARQEGNGLLIGMGDLTHQGFPGTNALPLSPYTVAAVSQAAQGQLALGESIIGYRILSRTDSNVDRSGWTIDPSQSFYVYVTWQFSTDTGRQIVVPVKYEFYPPYGAIQNLRGAAGNVNVNFWRARA